MKFKRIRLFIVVGLVSHLIGCATQLSDQKNILQKDLSKDLVSAEAKLMKETEGIQKYFEERHVLSQNPVIEKYLSDSVLPMIEKNGAGQAQMFHFHLIRDPTLNAFAMINGHIYFHTGIFTLVKNQEQIVFLAGHEMGHVFYRDVLYGVENLKTKTVAFKIADLLISPASAMVGMSSLTSISTAILYVASVTGYGRDLEERADLYSLDLMLKANYDPRSIPELFDALMKEKDKYQRGIEIYFLSTHPLNKARKEYVEKWMKEHEPEIKTKEKMFEKDDRYLPVTYEIRRDNAKLNLELNRVMHSLDDAELSLKEKPSDKIGYFYLGEIYRTLASRRDQLKEELSSKEWNKITMRDRKELKKEWLQKSEQAYLKSIQIDSQYGPPNKGLGIYYFQQELYVKARDYFQKYLSYSPEAPDRRSVIRFLEDIQSKQEGGRVQ